MKYLLFVCSMILLDVMGCPSNHQDYLEVSLHEIVFDNQWNVKTIEISSNTYWRIGGGASWLEVIPSDGNGDAKITVIAQPNESTISRYCTIFIKGEDNEEVRVYQAGNPLRLQR